MKNINPKISIIVPVYKVEKYLNRCLESIIAQTFTDWECILIDDGSPDNCGKICDEYAKKDERFINVFNKTYEKIYNQAKEDDGFSVYYLGKLNYYGIGIEDNKELGIRLLEKASKLNSAEAMKVF